MRFPRVPGPGRLGIVSAPDDARRLIPAAIDRFGARVHAVPPERWDSPTPCSEWSVRDLVAHMCFEHRWAPHVLAGEAMEDVGDRYDGDLLGDDPMRGWDRGDGGSRTGVGLDGRARLAGARVVRVAPGGGVRQVQMLVDLTVHEWDLARGAGLDERVDVGVRRGGARLPARRPGDAARAGPLRAGASRPAASTRSTSCWR